MSKKHVFFYKLFYYPVVLFTKLKFGYTFEKAEHLPDTYLVISNHTTDYDMLFVASSFPRQMYFVGSEHISRWKWLSGFLRYCFAPIFRPKGTLASTTVIEMLRKLRSGANVCLFAEGVRSWDGISCPILPSTGKMVKSARCGLVTYKITGGYFASPMWSSSLHTRRGYVHGAPVNIYTKEQLAAMTVEEINEVILRDLHEDAYETQMADPRKYTGKGLAEHLESLVFLCPQCGKMDTLRSQGDTVTCSACGHSFRYTEYGMLEGSYYTTVRDLAAWQKGEVEKAAQNCVTYTALSGKLVQIANHQETVVAQGPLSLSSTELICGDKIFPLEQISDLAMHGKRTIVLSSGKDYYELFPSAEANTLKFFLLYQELKKQSAARQTV